MVKTVRCLESFRDQRHRAGTYVKALHVITVALYLCEGQKALSNDGDGGFAMRRRDTIDLRDEIIMRTQQGRVPLRERLEEYSSEHYYICETDIGLMASEEGVSVEEVMGLLDQYTRRWGGRSPYVVRRVLNVLLEEE